MTNAQRDIKRKLRVFQYAEEVIGHETCPNCHGEKEIETFIPKPGVDINGPQVQELRVSAMLQEPTLVENVDAVGLEQVGEALGDEDRGATPGHLLHGVPQPALGAAVHA